MGCGLGAQKLHPSLVPGHPPAAPRQLPGALELAFGRQGARGRRGIWMEGNDPTQDSSLSPGLSMSLPEGSAKPGAQKRGLRGALLSPSSDPEMSAGEPQGRDGGPPPSLHVGELRRDDPRVSGALDPGNVQTPLLCSQEEATRTGVSAKSATLRGACTPQRGRVKPGAARPLTA